MRTIEVTRFGGPEVLKLRERPDPVAGPGQVVIDVAAIPVLWLDTALRSGKGRDWFPVEPPYAPGNGVAVPADGLVLIPDELTTHPMLDGASAPRAMPSTARRS